jgi:hypothetical protein
MDNVLYIHRQASITMLTGAEHPYPPPLSVVTKYLIVEAGQISMTKGFPEESSSLGRTHTSWACTKGLSSPEMRR